MVYDGSTVATLGNGGGKRTTAELREVTRPAYDNYTAKGVPIVSIQRD